MKHVLRKVFQDQLKTVEIQPAEVARLEQDEGMTTLRGELLSREGDLIERPSAEESL